MIELRITGCCAECQDIDLKLLCETFPCGPVYVAYCMHKAVCGRLEKEQFAQKLKDAQVQVIRTPEDNLLPMETRKE